MINQKQQKEMLDYLVAKLENSYSNVDPKKSQSYNGINANYIKLDNGLLLLADQGFLTKNGTHNINMLNLIYANALNYTKKNFDNANVGFIIYKDGENFFKSAAGKHSYKSKRGLSLKNYSDEDLTRMIIFRPEEKYIFDKKDGILQYFQSSKSETGSGIATYEFKPVIFDYSHIDQYQKFKPHNKPSERDHIFTSDEFMDEDMVLSNGMLVPYKE